MATDLQLTPQHDLLIENGDLQLIDEGAEVVQATKIRILFIQTEWVFDYTLGVPWFDDMFNTTTSKLEKDKIIKDTILGTLGVREITEFNFGIDPVNRGALVQFSADTTFGTIQQRLEL
jgi:hypothetical protein